MRHRADHILKLRSETMARFEQLMSVLYVPPGTDTVMINSTNTFTMVGCGDTARSCFQREKRKGPKGPFLARPARAIHLRIIALAIVSTGYPVKSTKKQDLPPGMVSCNHAKSTTGRTPESGLFLFVHKSDLPG